MSDHPHDLHAQDRSQDLDDELHTRLHADVAEMEPMELMDEIRRWSGHLAAGQARLILLLAAADEVDAWTKWGAAPVQFLSYACGIASGTARDQLRVARQLTRLPQVRDAFAAGELSYSQARAIGRVATPEDEGQWLDLASHMPASMLEKSVQAAKRMLDATDPDRKRGDDPEDGSTMRMVGTDQGFDRLVAHLDADDAPIVAATIAKYMRLARAQRVSAETPEGEQDSGDGSGDHSEPSPMCNVSGDVSAETPPPSSPQDRPLSWGRQACDALVEALRVAGAALDLAEASGTELPDPIPNADVHVTIPSDDLGKWAARVQTHTDDHDPHPPTRAHQIACDARIRAMITNSNGETIGIGRSSQTVPRWLRRAILRRDKHRCSHPHCWRTRRLHIHHIVWWTHGGTTDASNLVTLCHYHHRRVHDGTYQIHRTDDGQVLFTDARGVPLATRQTPPGGDADAIRTANEANGLTITATTPTSDWLGDPLDLDLLLGSLYQHRGRNEPQSATLT